MSPGDRQRAWLVLLVYVCVREGWVGVGRDKQKEIERESQREIHIQKEDYRMKSSEGDKERQADI